jgi:hypothetical protein
MTRRYRGIATITVIATILAFAAPPDVSAVVLDGTFVDDNGSVHENGIEAIALAGITVGCNPPANDRFCPAANLTRAEAATFFARAFDLPSDGTDHFVDDDGHILEGGIDRLAAAGITQGCNPPANDRFCPNRQVTRAEFAAFIARARNLPPSNVDHFVDDDGNVLEGSINRIADAGITVGCNPPANDRFCPNNNITRAETATLLTRALGLPHNPQRIPLSNWNPIRCSRDGERCSVSIETSAGRTHLVQEGLFNQLPYRSGEESQFLASSTTFTLTLDGQAVAVTQLPLSNSSTQAMRRWNTLLTFSEGNHVLVGEWRWQGSLIQRTTASISAD